MKIRSSLEATQAVDLMLEEARDLADRVKHGNPPNLTVALGNAEEFMRGASSGGHGIRGNPELTSTEAGAANPDRIAIDRDEAVKRLKAVLTDLAWLRRFVYRYTVTMGLVDPEGEQGCASCRRLPASHAPIDPKTGQPRAGSPKRWEPVWRTPSGDDKLPQAPLCRWCYDFGRAHDQWPPLKVLEAHHAGERITQARIEKALRR